MKKYFLIAGALLIIFFVADFLFVNPGQGREPRYSDRESGFEEMEGAVAEPLTESEQLALAEEVSEQVRNEINAITSQVGGRIQWGLYWRDFSEAEQRLYGSWVRQPGPLRVGIQAGHTELENVPEELFGLRASSGAIGGGKTEAQVVLLIAEKVKKLLEAEDMLVDLLPATVPVDYSADAFISIHADGNGSSKVSGFKISGPRRDFSGKAEELVSSLYESYSAATKLRKDSNITRRMSGYYAFNWRRYDHAVHPMTPSVIVETGFLTSPTDRAIIVNNPDRAAEGIARGIINFLSASK